VVTQPCPPSCSEVFNAQCIVYTGTDITCGQDTVVKRYDYLDTVITKIVNYICAGLANVPVTVVESDSEYILVSSSTVGTTTTYVLDLDFAQLAADLNLTLPVYNVVGSDNVFVTTTVVNNTTTFTLSALEAEVTNTDGLLDVTVNVTPGVDVIYNVNVDLLALTAALPQTSVIGGPSGNSFITPSVVGNLTTYSVDSKESIVAAGTHVVVTASGGTAPNYDTTYTVNGKDTTLALALGETILQLATATPSPNTTAYTLSTNTTALNSFVNTEINDVLDNTVGGFGIDAVYNGATQTLSINFDGAAVGVGGGILGNGTTLNPFVLDSNVPRKWVSTPISIPSGGSQSFTHTLNTLDVTVSGINKALPLPFIGYSQGVDYRFEINGPTDIEIFDLTGSGLPNFCLTVIG
jgi:hypothetical protein